MAFVSRSTPCAIFVAMVSLAGVGGARLKVKRHTKTSCGMRGGDASSSLRRLPNTSVVNGQPAKECEWRWQVGLRWNTEGFPWCGGMLIHPDWVLTAAHCVRSPNFNVVAGEYEPGKASGNEQSRWAAQVHRHPQYNARTMENDFALVRLESAIEINDCVGTVCLPTEGADVPAGTNCWISGWGKLFTGGPSPEVLQEGQVTTMSNADCIKGDYNSSEVFDSMLCAQGRSGKGEVVDACQGDSGGPLVCESSDNTWSLYGATSWGKGCAGEKSPGVWARVHDAIDWIEETMETNSAPIPTVTKCPDFSRNQIPDSDGDCQCNWGNFCSVSNGAARDCPTTSGAIGGWGGTYFAPDCADCQCFGTTMASGRGAPALVLDHPAKARGGAALVLDHPPKGATDVDTQSWRGTIPKAMQETCGVRGAAVVNGQVPEKRRLPNSSVVNGQPAGECEWRWQVGLRWKTGEAPWCGGMLIDKDWVLTAAHCVRSPNFNVVAGEYKVGELSGNEQGRWAAQVHQHPDYNPRTMENDFALVRLEYAVEINECVGTVCLPTEGADVPAGTNCWISGWGKLFAGGPSPEVLQEGQVTTMSNADCIKGDYNSSEVFDSMLCAQGRNGKGEVVDGCQGDSGGPLVCESSAGTWSLYGATSWGKGCAGEKSPGVWARVHGALGWIHKTLEDNAGPIAPVVKCPAFSRNEIPDSDGDCQCNWGTFCSVSGGVTRDCPVTNGAPGAWGGTYFAPGCADCMCYNAS